MSYAKQNLDNVCIMQKYSDSEKVLECQESFNKSKDYIIKSTMCHADLLEALELVLPMAKGYAFKHDVGNNMKYISQAQQAINKAEGV